MRLFHLVYDDHKFPVFASNHVAARRLGLRYLADRYSIVDTDKVAVVDPAIALVPSRRRSATTWINNCHQPRREDTCVVCKPSGKLAYWGECE